MVKDKINWILDKDENTTYFSQEFQFLFKSKCPQLLQNMRDILRLGLFKEENVELMRMQSLDEIKKMVWEMHSLKSLTPDGFLKLFYKRYWHIVGE